MIKKLFNSSTNELSEFCAVMIPNIWSGKFTKRLYSKSHLTFKNYIQKILTATQISLACILLGLYYIQQLRLAYPSIKASIGSEVRLFTTALVLANKILDDNTFTNKTWSEISSIPVHELNIMEMEFLSALDYNIHVQHQKYISWSEKCQQWFSALQSTSNHNYYPNSNIRLNNNNNIISNHINQINHKKNIIQYQPQIQYNTPIKFDDSILDQQPSFVYKPILSWSSSLSSISTTNQLYNNNNNNINNNLYK